MTVRKEDDKYILTMSQNEFSALKDYLMKSSDFHFEDAEEEMSKSVTVEADLLEGVGIIPRHIVRTQKNRTFIQKNWVLLPTIVLVLGSPALGWSCLSGWQGFFAGLPLSLLSAVLGYFAITRVKEHYTEESLTI